MEKKAFFLLLLVFPRVVLSVTIDNLLIDKELPAFEQFVGQVETYCNGSQWVPSFLTGPVNKIASRYNAYEVDINELKKLKPFFESKKNSKTGIDKLKEVKNIEYMQSIFNELTEKKSRQLFVEVMDKMTLKRLPDMPTADQDYFECMAANLFCVHLVEQKYIQF